MPFFLDQLKHADFFQESFYVLSSQINFSNWLSKLSSQAKSPRCSRYPLIIFENVIQKLSFAEQSLQASGEHEPQLQISPEDLVSTLCIGSMSQSSEQNARLSKGRGFVRLAAQNLVFARVDS